MTATTHATVNDRRADLLRLAEQVAAGECDDNATLRLAVPVLCSADLDDDRALSLFEQLVAEVAEHQDFTRGPADYALLQERSSRAETLAAIDSHLVSNVDVALDRMLGGAR